MNIPFNLKAHGLPIMGQNGPAFSIKDHPISSFRLRALRLPSAQK